MREITLEELLEAGCHFGHQVTRSNPKARDFIFEARDNIHIIDLAKTKEGLEEAAAFVKALASKEGSTMVVVGTKRQAAPVIDEEMKKSQGSGLYFITNRWVGGLLTNFQEVSKNFKKLKDITSNLKNEEVKAKYTKKEIGWWDKERQKLESYYAGVCDLQKEPDALFIIDSHLEDLAVREANRMGVITVAITDTNSDPSVIDYPIPANDDAVGSIKLITSYIIDAWIEGREALKKNKESIIKNQEKTEAKKERSEEKKKVKIVAKKKNK